MRKNSMHPTSKALLTAMIVAVLAGCSETTNDTQSAATKDAQICQSDTISLQETRLISLKYSETSALKYKAKTSDPQILFDIAPTCSTLSVEFSMEVIGTASLQAFYADEGKGFSENNSVWVQLGRGSNNVKFELPNTTKHLRIDPIATADSFSIDVITVNGGDIIKI